jgi:uncharacterized protein with GYD domain
MSLYMFQVSYTAESWAAQLKNPQNRADTVSKALCEAIGGKFVGAWYCFSEYDVVAIAEMPDDESVAAATLALAAGGAAKAWKTTKLLTGEQGVEVMRKADAVAKVYRPAR